uniref:Uncharacterized protein n=1 Tax=Phenylobacterium glaciei TaxID=2803784 RepID=A0A974P536_9CAUL|nr:hypothetical protein JKL49_03180 [Phenylobacterium glaciei]
MLLFGWLAVAAICGALPWRPHSFVYGPPNSGKTTIHGLVSDILYPLGLPADGQSTEAGIRQNLGPDSRAVILDEFETDHRQERLAAVMRFARSASSAQVPVLRGTQSGQALQYSVRTSLFFSAVNVGKMSPADETRVLMLELVAHGDDPEAGRTITRERQFFASMGPLWCSWMVKNVGHIAGAIAAFEVALARENSRHRTNMSTLLAGAYVALHGRLPTPEEAEKWVSDAAGAVRLHAQSHERDDAGDALSHLLGYLVSDNNGITFPLGHWIACDLAAHKGSKRPNDLGEPGRIVAIHDMRFSPESEREGLMIRHGSPAIDRVFQGTKWANGGWIRALGQIPGAFTPTNPMRFPNTPGKVRAVGLSLDLIPPPLDYRPNTEDY